MKVQVSVILNEKICSLPVDDVKRSTFSKSLLRLIWQVKLSYKIFQQILLEFYWKVQKSMQVKFFLKIYTIQELLYR